MLPQALTHQGDGIRKSRQGFRVPGGSTKGNGLPGAQDMGGEGDPGEQTKEDGSSTSNGQVRPLTLGLDSQVLSRMPRRLTVLSVESGESAEVGDDGLRTWRPVGPPSPGP